MLNEWIELQQYTFDLSCWDPDEIKPRLNYRNICNKLSGMERAMTVVARYGYYHAAPSLPTGERLELARELLKSWCGASEDCPAGFEHLRCWLPRYIETVLVAPRQQSGESVARLEAALEDLSRKKTEFSKKLLVSYISDDEASRWVNDYKKLTYDGLLAAAIEQGPLRNRLLVCKSDLLAPIRKQRGRLLDADKDRILKFLAAFLMGRTNDWQEYAVINKSDIANWCEDDPKLDKDDYEKYLFGDQPLFSVKQVGSNVVKLAVAKGYLQQCAPALCPEQEIPAGVLAFADRGAGRSFEIISVREREHCDV